MSQSEKVSSDLWIRPRDILTPSATLLGLVLAAIGLSNTVAGVSAILQTLSIVLVLVVLLFAGSALVTCLASLRRSHRLLSVGIVLFGLGWGFTAIVVSLFLLGNAWGIEIFQISIPQFPNTDIATLLSAAGSVLSVTIAVLNYRKSRINKEELIRLSNELVADKPKTQAILSQALDFDVNDPKMAFVRVVIELERILRNKATAAGLSDRVAATYPMRRITDYLSRKNVINNIMANSIMRIWRIRNMILHSGGDVSAKDAKLALDLAALKCNL